MKNTKLLIKTILLLAVTGLLSSCFLKTDQPSKKPLLSTKAPSVTPTPLAITPIPDPTAGWQTYTSHEYNFEIKYPPEWASKNDTQVFEEGDLFSVGIIGETQKPQTELYDGARLTIGIPIQTNQDLKSWVQANYPLENIHGEVNQFSEETIGGVTFQRVYTCGLGCFTYYHLKKGNFVYRIVVLAEGPDQAKYEQQLSQMLTSFKFLP